MKQILLAFTVIILNVLPIWGQKWVPETICSSDTLIIEQHPSIKYNSNNLNKKPTKIVRCWTRSNMGLRFDFAVSSYHYGDKTESWLGNHGGPNFNFILVSNKLNFGLRFKPWTLNPKKEMDFNGQTLPTFAKINPIKIDMYFGYSVDFNNLISVEPYIGYNSSTFYVINEDQLNQQFVFNKTGGLIIGTTFNKYFELKNDYEYLSVFGTVGYGFVDYEKVHSDLDKGYLEWSIGIAFKGFFIKRFNKKII